MFKEALGLQDNEALATVSREQVIRYMTGLKNKGLAAATIARKLAAIKSFYRFMTAEGYLELDPAEVVEAGTKGIKLPKVLNQEEVLKLLEQPDLRTDEGIVTERCWKCFMQRECVFLNYWVYLSAALICK